jgi:hypothetical protein
MQHEKRAHHRSCAHNRQRQAGRRAGEEKRDECQIHSILFCIHDGRVPAQFQ